VHCPYPNELENGQIMLIGVGGKFHYREYVEDIGHNNQIEYVCNKSYVLIGPPTTICDYLQLP